MGRAEVLNAIGIPDLSNELQEESQFHPACACGSDFPRGAKPCSNCNKPGISARLALLARALDVFHTHVRTHAHKYTYIHALLATVVICAVCRLPVRSLMLWCWCGHGGHVHHMREWFATHTLCPANCGHQCELKLSSATTPRAPASGVRIGWAPRERRIPRPSVFAAQGAQERRNSVVATKGGQHLEQPQQQQQQQQQQQRQHGGASHTATNQAPSTVLMLREYFPRDGRFRDVDDPHPTLPTAVVSAVEHTVKMSLALGGVLRQIDAGKGTLPKSEKEWEQQEGLEPISTPLMRREEALNALATGAAVDVTGILTDTVGRERRGVASGRGPHHTQSSHRRGGSNGKGGGDGDTGSGNAGGGSAGTGEHHDDDGDGDNGGGGAGVVLGAGGGSEGGVRTALNKLRPDPLYGVDLPLPTLGDDTKALILHAVRPRRRYSSSSLHDQDDTDSDDWPDSSTRFIRMMRGERDESQISDEQQAAPVAFDFEQSKAMHDPHSRQRGTGRFQ